MADTAPDQYDNCNQYQIGTAQVTSKRSVKHRFTLNGFSTFSYFYMLWVWYLTIGHPFCPQSVTLWWKKDYDYHYHASFKPSWGKADKNRLEMHQIGQNHMGLASLLSDSDICSLYRLCLVISWSLFILWYKRFGLRVQLCQTPACILETHFPLARSNISAFFNSDCKSVTTKRSKGVPDQIFFCRYIQMHAWF